MSGQLDLLPRSGVEVKPEPGRTEPRFWVRRLVMWKKPDTMIAPKVREIQEKFSRGEGLTQGEINTLLLKSQYNHINQS